jgi:hypothetical protein
MLLLTILIITYKSNDQGNKLININRVINKVIADNYLLS